MSVQLTDASLIDYETAVKAHRGLSHVSGFEAKPHHHHEFVVVGFWFFFGLFIGFAFSKINIE